MEFACCWVSRRQLVALERKIMGHKRATRAKVIGIRASGSCQLPIADWQFQIATTMTRKFNFTSHSDSCASPLVSRFEGIEMSFEQQQQQSAELTNERKRPEWKWSLNWCCRKQSNVQFVRNPPRFTLIAPRCCCSCCCCASFHSALGSRPVPSDHNNGRQQRSSPRRPGSFL